MTELDEKLAYLLDDYSGADDAAAVDEAVADVNLQYRLRRYRIVGEAMRQELPPAIDTGFHSSVMARIREQEGGQVRTQVRREPGSWSSRMLKPFAGLAVAASVALATVAIWQPLEDQGGTGNDNLVTADQERIQQLAGQQIAGDVVPASTRIRPLGLRWKGEADAPELQQKLNGYLVNHTEYSNSVQGLIPQARVAGFDAQQ